MTNQVFAEEAFSSRMRGSLFSNNTFSAACNFVLAGKDMCFTFPFDVDELEVDMEPMYL